MQVPIWWLSQIGLQLPTSRSIGAKWVLRSLVSRGLEGEQQVVGEFGGFVHGHRSESEAKQPAVFHGISQLRREHMV